MVQRLIVVFAAASCMTEPVEPAPEASTSWPVGIWNGELPATSSVAAPRGQVWMRTAIHVHSPYSHDACDGQGWQPDGLNEACHADLYRAFCSVRLDAAMLTDHPDYGDTVPLQERLLAGAEMVMRDGSWWGGSWACDGAPHDVWVTTGFEDTLMPVGLRTEVSPDEARRHDLLNRDDDVAFEAMRAGQGTVMLAHTEGRDLETLFEYQDRGLQGVEVFNVHAAFSPDIREEDLGLEPFGWAEGIGPFVQQQPGLEPDLLFLSVLEAQTPSLERFDALLARGPMMPTLGSDAHQNVLPTLLSDGERVDSYRRTLRFGTTWFLAGERSPQGLDEAVAAGRSHVVFELLGTPRGFDLALETAGTFVEVGGTGGPGTLVVGCPLLADGSPRGEEDPEIAVRVFRDGELWAAGCGRHPVGPGVYRVEVHQVPHHLRPFLGDVADLLIVSRPWIISGAVHVVEL
ncbi:MAG: hypothetical protein ACON5B_12915 [Myxococcota bacterium]